MKNCLNGFLMPYYANTGNYGRVRGGGAGGGGGFDQNEPGPGASPPSAYNTPAPSRGGGRGRGGQDADWEGGARSAPDAPRGGYGGVRGNYSGARGGREVSVRGGGGGPVDASQMQPQFPHERIDVVGQFGPNAGKHIDAYWEYKKIVQDDDGGTPFTPEQYERYKKEVIPKRIRNRVFVSWVNPNGMDCKCVGPETLCRCNHRYHQHKTDLDAIPETRPILLPCQVSGCRCKAYNFVPKNGSQSIRCRCKHFTEEHDVIDPFPCRSCKDCKEFKSSFTDNCSHPTHAHYTLVETRKEREKRGHPVGPIDVPYKAMGALTGFTALSEGYERLDESGIGRPSESLLDAPITSNDHPMLRMHAQAIHQRDVAKGKPIPDMETYEAVSGVKRPGESDMDYFERRYQERLRAERGGGGGGGPNRRAIQDRQPPAGRSMNANPVKQPYQSDR